MTFGGTRGPPRLAAPQEARQRAESCQSARARRHSPGFGRNRRAVLGRKRAARSRQAQHRISGGFFNNGRRERRRKSHRVCWRSQMDKIDSIRVRVRVDDIYKVCSAARKRISVELGAFRATQLRGLPVQKERKRARSRKSRAQWFRFLFWE